MDDNEDKLGYQPEVRSIQVAKDEVNDISSRLLDWMGVEGKTTQGSAAANICDEIDPDMKEYYSIHHPWSVYDLRKGSFEQAMENLRTQLPKHGWKITKDGVTKSVARNPEIVAVSNKSHHVVDIEWAKRRSGNLTQLISVNVDSRCYRAPKGTDISRDR